MDRFWAPELAKQALLLGGQYWRLEMPFAAAHESVSVQVFGRRDDDTIHALLRPASKKRQSTKSREVGHRRCRGRYGDFAAVRDLSAG